MIFNPEMDTERENSSLDYVSVQECDITHTCILLILWFCQNNELHKAVCKNKYLRFILLRIIPQHICQYIFLSMHVTTEISKVFQFTLACLIVLETHPLITTADICTLNKSFLLKCIRAVS